MKHHQYFVYILASRSRTLYTGITNSVERRTLEHREGSDGFTRRYRVWRLVYFERYRYVRNAIRREKQIKSWARWRKLALIERNNPTWEDLSLVFGTSPKLRVRERSQFENSQQIATSASPPRNDNKTEPSL